MLFRHQKSHLRVKMPQVWPQSRNSTWFSLPHWALSDSLESMLYWCGLCNSTLLWPPLPNKTTKLIQRGPTVPLPPSWTRHLSEGIHVWIRRGVMTYIGFLMLRTHLFCSVLKCLLPQKTKLNFSQTKANQQKQGVLFQSFLPYLYGAIEWMRFDSKDSCVRDLVPSLWCWDVNVYIVKDLPVYLERGRERKQNIYIYITSTQRFISKSAANLGQGFMQEPAGSSRCATHTAGAQIPEPSSAAFPSHSPELDLRWSRWDTNRCLCKMSCSTVTLSATPHGVWWDLV